MGHNAHHPPTRGFGLGQGLNNNHGFECLSQTMFKHARLVSIGKKNVPPHRTSRPNHTGPWVNKVVATNNKGKWIDQNLEGTMDVIEKGTCSLKATSGSWNILLTSLLKHLIYEKTRSWKHRPMRVLTNEENATIILHKFWLCKNMVC